MPALPVSSFSHGGPRTRRHAGRLAAAALLSGLAGLMGVPTACSTGSGRTLPPVSTAPIAPAKREAVAAGPRGTRATHVVRRGETLWGIARRYEIPLEELIQDNGIDPHEVRALPVGRVLAIPAASRSGSGKRAASVRVSSAVRPSSPRSGARATAAVSRVPNTALLAEAHLGQAQDRYDAADFMGALEDAREAGNLLQRLPASATQRRQRARALLIEGMAEAAMGDQARALSSFREARRLDPGLSLDPATTSPKLVSLFQRAGTTR